MRREQQQKRNFCGVVFLDLIGSFLTYFLTRYENISTQQKEKEDGKGVIHDDDENDDEVEMRGLQTRRLRM